ncbi:aldose 1-epimerase family protein [Sinomonas gamaensis]|uniref:aldose 1-epimerase family protein n=1 Tax=Sinomonas gamaensis TaxID=2565624 RepID=UPI0011082572|nr:aldose 1-epimerase family protein [Sinomonas gamaensis]
MRIDGAQYSRQQVESLVGDLRQLVDVTPFAFTDGPPRGMRGLGVRVVGGMGFDVLLDRGMDIGYASVGGEPLAWRSPRGPVGPAFAEHTGSGWTRTFGGGLLTTCGMTSIGAASRDGEELGLHGRVSSLPAEDVSYRWEWVGDELDILVEGRVVETDLGGPTLERRRTIRARAGTPVLRIEDTVTNTGSVDAQHMYRYHANFGFPLIRPGDLIELSGSLAGWRADAPPTGEAWSRVVEPSPRASEEVLYVETNQPADSGKAAVRRPGAEHPHLTLEWSHETMPLLVVWKFPRARTNVLGLEPSTARDDGRPAARARGEVITLRPGDSRTYTLTITASKGHTE